MEGGQEAPLHGDVLDAVVSRVSSLDLLPASRVSRAWRAAAVSTVRRSSRLPPWLVLHFQSNGSRHRHRQRSAVNTLAYDPLSRVWRLISVGHGVTTAAPISIYSHGNGVRFCTLSHDKLSLAADPFGATWTELEPPQYLRTQPTVAVLGPYVVLAGGFSEFEEDVGAVEVWAEAAGGWHAGEPMPDAFRWTTTFSVATSERRMYVLDPKQHILSWFDPAGKQWAPARRLDIPGPAVFASAIGFASGRLILVAVSGRTDERVGAIRAERLRLWSVDEDTMEVVEEMGRMPAEMVRGLEEDGSGGFWALSSVGFLTGGGFGYLYNPSNPKEFFLCEFGCRANSGQCRWERFERPATMDERPLDKVAFGCSAVSADDLRAVGLRN